MISFLSSTVLTHRNIAPALCTIIEETEKATLWLSYASVPLRFSVALLLDNIQSTTPWRHTGIYHQTVFGVSFEGSLDSREGQENGRSEIGQKSLPTREPAML